MTTLYRILPLAEWRAAQVAGAFSGSADDRRDGFIHLSTQQQVRETAARHYAGQADLMLLSVIGDRLAESRPGALKWELSRGGDRFPHLYASLPVDAVERAQPLPLGADGKHVFPALESASEHAGARDLGVERPTLRFTVRGTLAVFVSIDTVPSEHEWAAYCDMIEEICRRTGSVRVYARTDGGPPNAKQRKRVGEISQQFPLRSAVVTDSLVARAITGALALFNPEIRAFSPADADQAYAHLELSPEEVVWVSVTVSHFRDELRGSERRGG